MTSLKPGDIVRIKSLEWYKKNKNDKDVVKSKYGNDGFYPQMTHLCGTTNTVYKIHDDTNTIFLKDKNGFNVPYRFYEDWLEKEAPNQDAVQDQEDENVAYYKVTLEQAKEFWNSCNSTLQEIAMQCFSIEKLTEI